MAEIKIEAMKFYAFHGCFDEERVVGTHFEADCTIEVDCSQAAQTDNLSYTINYQEVYQLIKQEIEQPSALLENVAYRILSSLKQHYSQADNITIEIKKLNPPLGGKIKSVSVKMNSKELNIK